MGDVDTNLSFTSTEPTDNVPKQKQAKHNSTTVSQQFNEFEILGTSHCTMTNTMPTTTTTILTNAHPSAVTEDSISSPSTSSSLAMTPTSTTTVIAATFADCVSASATTNAQQQITQHSQSTDDSISGLTTSTTSVMLNGTNSFNNSNINNNTIDTLEIKLAASTESSKSPELCLSSSSSSINGAVAPPSILIPPNTSCGYSSNPEQGSGGAMWSNIDDGSHMSLNGYNNYQNYTSSPTFNGASPNSIAAAMSQHNRRAITASHGIGSFQHGPHGLSPNIGFNNNFPTWSNPPPWPSTGQQQQQTMQSWNRGRSVPNLNPMTNVLPNRKPTSPNPGLSPSSYSTQQNTAISPSKYRRSTSFPGKVQGQGGYPGAMDVQGSIDDGREAFMQYQ
ncbi:hypothetical protein Bhyg_09911 [Pseudolycoriella hygida]|uniref:Uncharacterized protein n=1 Tax=Pseudolycoriella hygida TaxID=35572 RepID=A0A9Q0RYP7_9DIPT|nr:hypothetical protein Bhyg_09911 [Pseudolycoriella hygida]